MTRHMKKYLRLQCSVCYRTIDQLVDLQRVTPDKCTITYKCQGRLFPVEYRSDSQIAPAPVAGVLDWKARNSTSSTSSTTSVSLLETASGSLKQIVLAAKSVSAPFIHLKLKQRTETPRSYKQFVYRFNSSFSSVSGVESGLEKKTLRYSATDEVQVYLNGAQLNQGTGTSDYQLNVVPNTITFNSTITTSGIYQVDVIVTTVASTTYTYLTFKRNQDDDSRRSLGAWENVDSVKYRGSTYNLYTLDLDDATSLKLNTVMTVDGVFASSSSTAPTTGYVTISSSTPPTYAFLFARYPYTQIDRYVSIWAPLENFDFERDYFKYVSVDNTPTLFITSTTASTIFPPLVVIKFNTEKTLTSITSGSSDKFTIDTSTIVGPDT